MNEFSNLTLQEKARVLHLVDDAVLELFIRNDPSVILVRDNKLPPCLTIEESNGEHCVKSLSTFKKGDIIFEHDLLLIQDDNKVFMKLPDGTYYLVDNIKHTVKRDNYREFYYFDIFTNHSCDPNAEVVYLSRDRYQVVALKDINKGDEITNDYTEFDFENDCELFECNCGSPHCKKLI